jgi:hypothetical protein
MRSLHWSAKKRNLEFAINAEYLWQLWLDQDGKCAYTGRQLELSGNASLDRRDSKQGYIESNVQWVHANVNTLKWDMSEAEFYNICEEILNYRRFKNG